MNIILWLLLGALAGWISSKIMGDANRGLVFNIIVGIIGAALGGFVASWLGLGAVSGFNFYSLLIAIGGACLLEVIVRWLSKKMR